jgi:DNA-binding response OmpR family regulator
MSDAAIPGAPRVPNIYFIDDSATMREVIKIAFRKESIHVVACHDAATALALFAESRPDAVITDVIMPDKDGYEVCRFVKQHPELGSTPVILMSGVVNREVAQKAMEAGADELMRKPFQPQELVTRVKSLLNPKPAGAKESAGVASSAASPAPSLSSLFAPPVVGAPPAATSAFASEGRRAPVSTAPRSTVVPNPLAQDSARPATGIAPSVELLKLRAEIRRLEMLVKKLQSELEAERQYCSELESQLRVHQETS